MTQEAEKWLQNAAWVALVALVSGFVSWAAWATLAINARTTPEEVAIISPYLRDKQWIQQELVRVNHTIDNRFAIVIENNTKAIIKLEAQMSIFNSALQDVQEAAKADRDQAQKDRQKTLDSISRIE